MTIDIQKAYFSWFTKVEQVLVQTERNKASFGCRQRRSPLSNNKLLCEEESIMKKSLVLVMAMALGVTASAYAANPFSDVPAGHWAYDSINKLAAASVIEGYGDTTFGGDKLMTRYEMAQIVAKAMAKGANVDKLAAEFAEELDNWACVWPTWKRRLTMLRLPAKYASVM